MRKNINTAKGRKISSTKWLERQLNDPFVEKAKKFGYRSRASFKLIEINDKFKIFERGQKVLDLGSAPGGWSQIIVKKVGEGNVDAVDLLNMEYIKGVNFIQGDFLSLGESLSKKYDVIVSDMAANTTGNKSTDQIRTAELVEQAFNFAIENLKEDGCFIAKIFQSKEEQDLFGIIRKHFKTLKRFKPESSRKESVEIYFVGINKI
ncbi:MAG: RlmE family RNA methyltransferase [Rickettsiales bacterium]|jgi:23S rRNA (uridine2552-2'-O)-methyltransferase|nr:RlmE family RNA methyltransferase [Rickettsiales bacterium]